MTGFSTILFGEPLFLDTASGETAEILAYYFGFPFLEPAPRPAEGANIIPLSEIEEPTESESESDSLPRLLRRAVFGMAKTLNYRFLFLHASAFAGNGGAVLFSGPGGSGKTTLAMVADALGHPVLGEDIVAVDWRTRMVHPMSMPYRPRPFTRRLLREWGLVPTEGKKIILPVRPGFDPGPAPISRLYLSGGENESTLTTLLNGAFRPSGINPFLVARQLASAVRDAPIHRTPPLRIRKDLDLKRLENAFLRWIEPGGRVYPPDLFENAYRFAA